MEQEKRFRYLSENEMLMGNYIKIPKELYTSELYKALSNDAILLYGILLDRFYISVKNDMRDYNKRIYIITSVKEVMKILRVGKQKASKTINELIDIELLKAERREGLNRKRRFYLGEVIKKNIKANSQTNKSYSKKLNGNEATRGPINIPKAKRISERNFKSTNSRYINNNTNTNYSSIDKPKESKNCGSSLYDYGYLQEFDFED